MRYTVVFSGNLFWILDTKTNTRGRFYEKWEDANKEADRRNANE